MGGKREGGKRGGEREGNGRYEEEGMGEVERGVVSRKKGAQPWQVLAMSR